jgi:hypothetical protein
MQESESPIDNQTYDLLQVLTSKLEAVEAYQVYEEDMSGEAADVLMEIARDDRRHVERLVKLLGIKSAATSVRH